MLTDGVRAMRVSIAVLLLAIAWIAGYAIFNDAFRDLIGDGAHGSAFLALMVAVSAAITAVFFHRLARVRAAVAGGDALARWQVDRPVWQAFAAAEFLAVRADHRAGLVVIAVFALLIPGAMALLGGDPAILAWISLAIMAVGGAGYLLGERVLRAHAAFHDGIVAIGRQGLVVNGVAHTWALPGSSLRGASLDERRQPAVLTIRYAYWTKHGLQGVAVRAPVPEAALPAARRTAEALSRSGDDAGRRI